MLGSLCFHLAAVGLNKRYRGKPKLENEACYLLDGDKKLSDALI